MDHEAGEGEIYLDKDVFQLSGTLHGEKIEHTVSTEKLVAFPISPGHHFDIYIDGKQNNTNMINKNLDVTLNIGANKTKKENMLIRICGKFLQNNT